MSSKQIDVACPCCDSRLSIDVRTGKIMRWAKPRELDDTGKPALREESWDDALSKVSGREEQGRDRFDSALRKEQSRDKDLDDLFRRAHEKAREPESGDSQES